MFTKVPGQASLLLSKRKHTCASPCAAGQRHGKGHTCLYPLPPGYFQAAQTLPSAIMFKKDIAHCRHLSSEGATQQMECPPGMFSEAGAIVCIDCPKGWYQEDYGQQLCWKCPTEKTTASKGSRSCIAIQPSDAIKILDTEPAGNQVRMKWQNNGDFRNTSVSFSIPSVGNQMDEATLRHIKELEIASLQAVINLLYGLKYYFHISALNSRFNKGVSVFPASLL